METRIDYPDNMIRKTWIMIKKTNYYLMIAVRMSSFNEDGDCDRFVVLCIVNTDSE